MGAVVSATFTNNSTLGQSATVKTVGPGGVTVTLWIDCDEREGQNETMVSGTVAVDRPAGPVLSGGWWLDRGRHYGCGLSALVSGF